jgi:hypothetical protein
VCHTKCQLLDSSPQHPHTRFLIFCVPCFVAAPCFTHAWTWTTPHHHPDLMPPAFCWMIRETKPQTTKLALPPSLPKPMPTSRQSTTKYSPMVTSNSPYILSSSFAMHSCVVVVVVVEIHIHAWLGVPLMCVTSGVKGLLPTHCALCSQHQHEQQLARA